MPTISLILFFLHNLLNAFLLRLVPKKLRPLLPASWYHQPTTAPAAIPKPPHPPRHPRMESEDLSRLFQMFDRNGDGRITKAELNHSLENMGISIPDADLVAMIEKIDVNGDGCVDIDEFGALYQSLMAERNEEEDMREAFNVFDINGDGFITEEELKSVLSSLGLKQGRSLEDCKRMIGKVDGDGDGRVDFAEFKHMMKRGGFAALSS